MGQKPAELTPDASPWHRWGADLRAFREARGLSLGDLGALVHVSISHLSKIERAQRSAHRPFAAACDEHLNLAGALLNGWDRANAALRAEGAAAGNPRVHVSNRTEHVSTTPLGLAPGRPAEEWSEDEGISVPCRLRDGRMVFVTVPRRAFLGLGAVTAMGGLGLASDATAARLRSSATYGATPIEHFTRLRRHLIDSDNLLGPRQVIPTVHQHLQTLQVLRQNSSGSDRLHLLDLQTQYAEFAGWLHQDIGDLQAAQYWLNRALQWSHTIGAPDLTSYVLARQSQLAGEKRDVFDVVDLAEAAQRMARPQSRLAAVGQTYAGYGHALNGNASASHRAFDDALAVAVDPSTDPSPWGVWLDASYIEVHRAYAQLALGQHDAAATGFAAAIRRLPEGYHRDRGVYLARQAVAHAGAGDPEQAAQIGLQAVTVAQDTGSGRILHELARLDVALQPWTDLPDVLNFRTGMDDVVIHEAVES